MIKDNLLNQKEELEILLQKPDWTIEEKQWLLAYLENSDGAELQELMRRLFLVDLHESLTISGETAEQLLKNIHEKIILSKRPGQSKLVRMWTIRVASACIIGLLACGTYYLLKTESSKKSSPTTTAGAFKNDVAPGGDKAILTLADGTAIILDDVKNGTLARQGNTRVIKINGKLNYHVLGTGNGEVLYNTIATPRGGQYQVELPDGSKVWLNAASSLRFPTTFTGKSRRVEINGEVYFEVAKHKSMPFIVGVNGAEIQVIGTHFNVMAYNDESTIQTTLLEGSVKFSKDASNTSLKPGQQLQVTKQGKFKMLDDVDIDKVVAWKNGFFDFEGSDFETIAKQLSRWYDTEVMYTRKFDELFYAVIPRDTKLSDVLKALELTGKVRFRIEGKKIIVLP
ncbi:MAG: FecR family protein [Ferruginibacter sp.]